MRVRALLTSTLIPLLVATGVACSSVSAPGGDSLSGAGSTWTVERDGTTGLARFAYSDENGPPVLDPAAPGASAIKFLTDHADVFGVPSSADLSVEAVNTDPTVGTFVAVEQTGCGLPIVGASAVLGFRRDGSLAFVRSSMAAPPSRCDSAVKVSRSAAEASALADFRRAARNGDATVASYRMSLLRVGANLRKVHEFTLASSADAVHTYIGTDDGSRLRTESAQPDGTVEASVDGMKGARTIPMWFDPPKKSYALTRRNRPARVDFRIEDEKQRPIAAKQASGPWPREAVDGYANAIAFEEWLGTWPYNLGRRMSSYGVKLPIADPNDPPPIPLVIGVLGAKNCGEAAAQPSTGQLKLGNCEARTWYQSFWSPKAGTTFHHFLDDRGTWTSAPSTTAPTQSSGQDVIEHELTHFMVAYEFRLSANGEPAALNESLADTMALLYRHKASGDESDGAFMMTQESWNERIPLRNLVDPRGRAVQQGPRRYGARYTGTADDGGAHINSLIPSHAFFLMARGGTHVDTHVRVPALGWARTDEFFRMLFVDQVLLGATSFRDAAESEVMAAEMKWGRQSAERASLYCAWRAVEVLAASDDAALGAGASCAAVADAGADGVAPPAPTPDASPPAPAPDASAPPTRPADCAGRADGVYCDAYVSPRDAFVCKDQKRGPGTQCPTGKACDPSKDGQPSTQPDAFCK